MLVAFDQLRVAVLNFTELLVVEGVFVFEDVLEFNGFLVQNVEAFGLVAELHLMQ